MLQITQPMMWVIKSQPVKPEENTPVSRYYRTSKITDLRKAPRTWRTRKDPFEKVWDETKLRLELMPETTAKETVTWLMGKYPSQFTIGQIKNPAKEDL